MEKFFWADKIAEDIIKERGKKKEYVCASGIGVSGTLHIGNFRDAITTDLVVRALKDAGKKTMFIYSWDDYDRFRKIPANLPENKKKEYEKYIGMAVSDIPAPTGKESYSEYFEKPFEKSLKKVGINPKFISQSKMNKACKYAELIKKALDDNEEIKKILNRYRKEPLSKNWYPVTVYCEKCKKDSTQIINVEGYFIEYICECGFTNKIDFRKKGIVKLKWRIDWPARWFYEKVDFEPGGADINAAGGSYVTGKEISKKIYDYEPPKTTFYEFVTIKGAGGKISGSKGNVLTIDDVEEIYEPEILRYLFVGTRPSKSFDISFDNDVIKIYEDYDALEEKYYSKKANMQEKRIYEMCQLNKLKKKRPEKKSFRHLITFVQVGKTKDFSKEDKFRAEKVKNWLEKYAGDDMKFKVQERISIKLNEKEKNSLIELREILKQKSLTEEQLFNEFYEICKNVGINNKEFFDAAYRVIINKKKGPRLASLILAIGKEKIIKLLNQIK
ncbi:MAG: lysine--tRNA ligase [Nanoarchaeota archaeon]|nr:lysine--tRNA ligase [Nanoarchaeota archaeon]